MLKLERTRKPAIARSKAKVVFSDFASNLGVLQLHCFKSNRISRMPRDSPKIDMSYDEKLHQCNQLCHEGVGNSYVFKTSKSKERPDIHRWAHSWIANGQSEGL